MTTNCDWCVTQEALLKKWAEKSAGYRWLHNHARLLYKRQNDWLSYPTIIMSSITGVGGFAVLSPSEEDPVVKHRILLIQYFFAFLNVMSGIINSISKFNNASKLMESHSIMCVQYSKFYRNIDMELSLEPKDRVSVVEFVTKCRLEYDRLLSEAPDIPSESIIAFNKEFKNKTNKPDVCNGLSVIQEEKSSIFETILKRTSSEEQNSTRV